VTLCAVQIVTTCQSLTIFANLGHAPPMATMNISLPDKMKAWVESRTADGRYANASDYVRDLIRKDQERDVATATLLALIEEGDASGDPEDWDFDAFIAEMNAKHGG
jgi:antitoxin ParD1/3/4